ncbi:transcription factor Tfb2-domain-containing protein [Jimgerdemannia flammicorona]|uniref:RNA polymerase II transcription factor B subunit 2 n=1 Tax=Jimgerdemannia flammicorona TaxID=994334 RepID=A0A433CW55_9FUNG|nr:transcription factor Tfb2-domain-containing protein [Jimgerdemannia flammicorona]
MPTILHFKTNIYEYLETLSLATFNRLFQKPATCLAIFRLLPSIGRQIVMALLYVEQPILKTEVQDWVYKEGKMYVLFRLLLQESLDKLAKLHILEDKEKDGQLVMNSVFREQFRNALTGGGDQQSFGLPCATADKHRVDVMFLDQHANQQWEVGHRRRSWRTMFVAGRVVGKNSRESSRGVFFSSRCFHMYLVPCLFL